MPVYPGAHTDRLEKLNERFGLLTGQSLPIQVVSGNCALRYRSCPLFARPTRAAQLEPYIVVHNIGTQWIPAIPKALRTRPGYSQRSGFQHSPICTSVATRVALSEDKKTG